MNKAREHEREARLQSMEKGKIETSYQDLRHRQDQLQRQQTLLRDENANMKHDLNVLINVISSARTHGRWDVSIFFYILVYIIHPVVY